MTTHTETFTGDGLSVADSLDETVPYNRMRVLPWTAKSI